MLILLDHEVSKVEKSDTVTVINVRLKASVHTVRQ